MISSFIKSAVITFSKLLLQEMCLRKVLIKVHDKKTEDCREELLKVMPGSLVKRYVGRQNI